MTCMQHGPETSPEAKIAVVINRGQPSNHVFVTVASDRGRKSSMFKVGNYIRA
jgi:hypothetical protein